jgi:hypothetical protein
MRRDSGVVGMARRARPFAQRSLRYGRILLATRRLLPTRIGPRGHVACLVQVLQAPSNMALQRTPRPRFLKVRSGTRGSVLVRAHAGTGRSLRSLGSPLNARPLGRLSEE